MMYLLSPQSRLYSCPRILHCFASARNCAHTLENAPRTLQVSGEAIAQTVCMLVEAKGNPDAVNKKRDTSCCPPPFSCHHCRLCSYYSFKLWRVACILLAGQGEGQNAKRPSGRGITREEGEGEAGVGGGAENEGGILKRYLRNGEGGGAVTVARRSVPSY